VQRLYQLLLTFTGYTSGENHKVEYGIIVRAAYWARHRQAASCQGLDWGRLFST